MLNSTEQSTGFKESPVEKLDLSLRLTTMRAAVEEVVNQGHNVQCRV